MLPFDEGVMVADAVLRAGRPPTALEAAVELAGPRKAGGRILRVVAFGHPGGESAAESRSRCTLLRLGVPPPELQHEMVLDDGSRVFLDGLFRAQRAGVEIDGAKKYLDPRLATQGAGRAIHLEKLREDAVRAQLRGFARWGWAQSGSTTLLLPVLRRIGVEPASPRAVLSDYAAVARSARPRRIVQR